MPFSIACPACSCRMRAPDNSAGKSAECPKCKTKFVIPASAGEAKSVPSSPAPACEVPQSAPMRTISCLVCFNPVGVPADATGKVVTCAKCQTPFLVPAPGSNTTFGVAIEPTPPREPGVNQPAPSATHAVTPGHTGKVKASTGQSPANGLRPCKHCGQPVAPSAKTCPGCGGKSPYPLKPQEWLMGCAGFAVIVVVFMACCTGGDPENRRPTGQGSVLRNGDTGYIAAGDESRVWVAIDEAADRELNSYSRPRNAAAVEQMIRQGRVLDCRRRTKVSVVSAGIATTTVRMMEGDHEGKSGIVPSEWVHK